MTFDEWLKDSVFTQPFMTQEELMRIAFDAGQRIEREACAMVCETFYNHEAKDCAEAIRDRSNVCDQWTARIHGPVQWIEYLGTKEKVMDVKTEKTFVVRMDTEEAGVILALLGMISGPCDSVGRTVTNAMRAKLEDAGAMAIDAFDDSTEIAAK